MTNLPNLTKLLEQVTIRGLFEGSPKSSGDICLRSQTGEAIAMVFGSPYESQQVTDHRNARFFTFAVNNFEALVDTLGCVLRTMDTDLSDEQAIEVTEAWTLLAKIEREAGER